MAIEAMTKHQGRLHEALPSADDIGAGIAVAAALGAFALHEYRKANPHLKDATTAQVLTDMLHPKNYRQHMHHARTKAADGIRTMGHAMIDTTSGDMRPQHVVRAHRFVDSFADTVSPKRPLSIPVEPAPTHNPDGNNALPATNTPSSSNVSQTTEERGHGPGNLFPGNPVYLSVDTNSYPPNGSFSLYEPVSRVKEMTRRAKEKIAEKAKKLRHRIRRSMPRNTATA